MRNADVGEITFVVLCLLHATMDDEKVEVKNIGKMTVVDVFVVVENTILNFCDFIVFYNFEF